MLWGISGKLDDVEGTLPALYRISFRQVLPLGVETGRMQYSAVSASALPWLRGAAPFATVARKIACMGAVLVLVD